MEELGEDQLVSAFKALGHPTRLAILGWLKDGNSFPPQDQPADEVGVSQSTVAGDQRLIVSDGRSANLCRYAPAKRPR